MGPLSVCKAENLSSGKCILSARPIAWIEERLTTDIYLADLADT
jgi:hypothetical protein